MEVALVDDGLQQCALWPVAALRGADGRQYAGDGWALEATCLIRSGGRPDLPVTDSRFVSSPLTATLPISTSTPSAPPVRRMRSCPSRSSAGPAYRSGTGDIPATATGRQPATTQ